MTPSARSNDVELNMIRCLARSTRNPPTIDDFTTFGSRGEPSLWTEGERV